MKKILKETKDYSRLRYDQFALFEQYAREHGLQSKSISILMWVYYMPNGITQNFIVKKHIQVSK